MTSDLTDARDCTRKRSIFIGSVNKLLGSYGKIQSNVLCKLFQIYCCSFYGSELWCCNSYGFNRCVTEWNKAMRRILRIPYRSHRWLLAQLGQQKHIMEHLHVKLLRYLTYALNHDNPIVRKFTNIALRCARSPMGANIALLRHLYDVSIVTKLHDNEQTICNFYKFNDDEQYATVGVLRDLINCRDGLYDIHYFNYDDITAIIDELCTNWYARAKFIWTHLYSLVFCFFPFMLCSIMLHCCIWNVLLYFGYELKMMMMNNTCLPSWNMIGMWYKL